MTNLCNEVRCSFKTHKSHDSIDLYIPVNNQMMMAVRLYGNVLVSIL